MDWREFVETMSIVEQTLRDDLKYPRSQLALALLRYHIGWQVMGPQAPRGLRSDEASSAVAYLLQAMLTLRSVLDYEG
jgi:hypothetical protein